MTQPDPTRTDPGPLRQEPATLQEYFEDLTSWTASDTESAWQLKRNSLQDTELLPIAEYHGPHGRETALICFNAAATWDEIPGTPSIDAIHIQRDLAQRVFTMRAEQVPTVPLAERWLADRGIPVPALAAFAQMERSADQLTRWSEERIRDSGTRFEAVDHFTDTNREVWVIFRDHDPGSLGPFLVQLETPNPELDYQIRESRFATFEEAREWCFERDTPPAPTSELVPRSHSAIRVSEFIGKAALARSTAARVRANETATPTAPHRPAHPERGPGR